MPSCERNISTPACAAAGTARLFSVVWKKYPHEKNRRWGLGSGLWADTCMGNSENSSSTTTTHIVRRVSVYRRAPTTCTCRRSFGLARGRRRHASRGRTRRCVKALEPEEQRSLSHASFCCFVFVFIFSPPSAVVDFFDQDFRSLGRDAAPHHRRQGCAEASAATQS